MSSDKPLSLDLTVNRYLLSDQATDRLRSAIIRGVIAPGSRLVEEDLARLLGISRAPTREALAALEQEGFVVHDGRGRSVFKPTHKDIAEVYEVRLPLEKLAFRKAAQNTNPEHRAILLQKLAEIEAAIATGDYGDFIQADMALHREVWRQAGNAHLFRTLNFMVGLIFMVTYDFHSRTAWDTHLREHDLKMHRTLVSAINRGDAAMAERCAEEHLSTALELLAQLAL